MIRIVWKMFKILLLLLLLLAAGIAGFVLFAPVLGGSPDKQSSVLIERSSNHDGDKFVNKIPTSVSTPDPVAPIGVWGMISPPPGKNPAAPLPSRQFNKAIFGDGDFVWLGHSTILLKTDGLTVMTDPVFYNASPIPFTITPFPLQQTTTIEQLPAIDVVTISHDHYDHLDYKAILELDARVGRYLVPLGVKAHLQKWGVADDKITEMDWYDKIDHQSLTFTMAPSRHFSGRSFKRATTLWGSWIIKSKSLTVYFSGDSGYFDEFRNIGERFGPFDLAFVENGAYNLNWSQIHMMPEESVQAAIDLKAKVFFPIHWGKYDLSSHSWTEPVTRAKAAAMERGVALASPLIGEVFTPTSYPVSDWWLDVR
ncbi:hypothetical protein AB833_14975 [Chromatiales bacterium (ex Bugula neritina AB1)]|nr:hypothetical protein AB833_14975 [Chromatiales bacterium (ex Bugula neritina AB1)]